jgi:hypothetical protein
MLYFKPRGDGLDKARGFVNAILFTLYASTVVFFLLLLAGCSTVNVLTEYQHISHASQHVGSNRTSYGYDMISIGVRWKPTQAVTIDLLEGYNFQRMHGRDEVFTGRMTVEF